MERGRLRLHPHGEFVAKVARGGFAHAGNAQMLAQKRGEFEVKIVQRHQAIDLLRARQIGDGVERMLPIPLLVDVGHVEDFVDGFGGPAGGFA